jgi:hypothetical protein
MVATVTPDDIKALQPTSLADAVIQDMIDCIDEADACLTGAGVSDAKAKLLKSYAVAHQVLMAAGGSLSSQRAQSGAAKSFAFKSDQGLPATVWGQMLKQMDSSGCVVGLLENTKQYNALSIGPGGG